MESSTIENKTSENNQIDKENQKENYENPLGSIKLDEETIILNEYKTNLNSLIDFSLLKKYLDNISNKDPEIIPKKFEKFKEKTEEMIHNKLTAFKERINAKFAKTKEKIEKKFIDIERDFQEAESRVELNNIENFNNISTEEILNFFEKNGPNNNNPQKHKEIENMVYLVKKYSDQEKIKKNLYDIETLLYSKMLASGQGLEFTTPNSDKFLKDTKNFYSEISRDLEVSIPSSSIHRVKKNNYFQNPLNLKYKKDITDKLQKNYTIDSIFCAFTTYDGISYVSWGSPHHYLEIYDLMEDKIVKSIAGFNAHIYITRHFFDKLHKKDYLLTTTVSKTCKIFDCKDFSNILTLTDCHKSTYMYSGLIIFDLLKPDNPFIVTSAPNEDLKVWDFGKQVINTIKTKGDYTYYLNVFYDNRNNENKIYIINANGKDVKLYDYRTGDMYKTFVNKENGTSSSIWHMSAAVKLIDEVPHLFESDGNGNFNIWNIDTGSILKKVQIKGLNLRGICIWNDDYVIIASSNKAAKVISFNKESVEGQIEGHTNIVCTVDKINHPLYGESVLTGAIDGKIKLYTMEENIENNK